MQLPRRRLALVTIAAWALGAAPAFAAGWEIEVQGLRTVATSLAGRACFTEDASTVWYNPASMIHLEGWTVTGALALINLEIEYHDQGSTSILGQPLTGDPVKDAGALNPVPHLYVTRSINERVAVGLGFNIPFGLGTDYEEAWVGRYHATETTLLLYNLNPSVAYRVNDQLSLGGGVNLQYSDAVFANMIDFGSIGAASMLPLTPQMHDGKVSVEGDDFAVGFNIGLLWEPRPETRVGITYRSETVHGIEGTAKFTVPPEADPLTGGGLVFQDTKAVAELPMPQFVSVSLYHRVVPPLILLGDVTWTEWSAFSELVVAFENPAQPPIRQAADWDDIVRLALGGIYEPGGSFTFRAGVAHEPSAIPDRTRGPRVPEGYHTWLTLGGSYRASERIDVDLLYVHLFSEDAAIDFTDPNAGRLVGETRWNINTVGIGGTLRF